MLVEKEGDGGGRDYSVHWRWCGNGRPFYGKLSPSGNKHQTNIIFPCGPAIFLDRMTWKSAQRCLDLLSLFYLTNR